jgi:hypothetical protein
MASWPRSRPSRASALHQHQIESRTPEGFHGLATVVRYDHLMTVHLQQSKRDLLIDETVFDQQDPQRWACCPGREFADTRSRESGEREAAR